MIGLQEKKYFKVVSNGREYNLRNEDGVWYISPSDSEFPESILVNPNQALKHLEKGEEGVMKIEKVEKKIVDIFITSATKIVD